MKSAQRGESTLDAEVTNVSRHGFWILIDDTERFVSFSVFPWFAEASIRQLTTVERPSAGHLYWPALDVDLAVDSLDHPERYPLVSRVRPGTRSKPTAIRLNETRTKYRRSARASRRG
ncbi:MAG: DUF2442 domain-containing protein [Candidatus Rokuibacteriota bacterium]